MVRKRHVHVVPPAQPEPAPASRSAAVGGPTPTTGPRPVPVPATAHETAPPASPPTPVPEPPQTAPQPVNGATPPTAPLPAKVEKVKTLAQQVREDVDQLFDVHGGQLHLRDVLNAQRQGEPLPLCDVEFLEEETTATAKNKRKKEEVISTELVAMKMEWPKLFEVEQPILTEDRTGMQYAFARVPVNVLGVDDEVNPRHLQKPRVEKLVEAFKSGQTRFQMAICRLLPRESRYALCVFDGSHGTAGEILAGAKFITCKIFLPGKLTSSQLFEWNTEAHSTLRQQEFRSRVLMSRRAKIFKEDFDAFLKTNSTTFAHSERGFIGSLPAYERQMKMESIYDYVYAAVLEDEHEVEYEDPTTQEMKVMLEPSCKLQKFVRRDEQQKRGGKLLGYDLLKSSILKEFVQQAPSDRIVSVIPHEEWPRELERENLVRLGNILAEVMLEGKWGQVHEVEPDQQQAADTTATGKKRGTRKKHELTAEGALTENLWKKGPVRIWSRRLRDAIGLMLRLAPSDVETVFQRNISGEVWLGIRQAVEKIAAYGGWTDGRVMALLGSNIVGEIERTLEEWAEQTASHRLDAYYLAGQERP